jgi:nuclear transport factor 2 (NTF2) superfamily protein
MDRPPLPPFTRESAIQKARMAEDAWNSRDPARVALAYTTDSRWRNRAEFLQGREAIEAFLKRKWDREQGAMGFSGQSHRSAFRLRVA